MVPAAFPRITTRPPLAANSGPPEEIPMKHKLVIIVLALSALPLLGAPSIVNHRPPPAQEATASPWNILIARITAILNPGR